MNGSEAREIVSNGLKFGDLDCIEAVRTLDQMSRLKAEGLACWQCESQDVPLSRHQDLMAWLCAGCLDKINRHIYGDNAERKQEP